MALALLVVLRFFGAGSEFVSVGFRFEDDDDIGKKVKIQTPTLAPDHWGTQGYSAAASTTARLNQALSQWSAPFPGSLPINQPSTD